jgi:hypothetical protein
MACWTPGPWDQVADPAAANALRICSAANGEDPVNCPMPKAKKAKAVAEPVAEPEE